MFMRVDANSDGTVDWNEYISYLLTEVQLRQAMNLAVDQRCLPTKLTRRVKPNRKTPSSDRSDDVVRIVFLRATNREANVFKV